LYKTLVIRRRLRDFAIGRRHGRAVALATTHPLLCRQA